MLHDAPPGVYPYLIAVLALGLLIRRSLRGRPIKVERLWIIPTLLLTAAVYLVVQDPPRESYGPAVLALAGLAGAGIGWQRGRLTRISLDAESGVLTSKASPAAVILIAALFVARYGLKIWMAQNPAKGAGLALATDGLTMFGAATVAVARAEMWLRCRRLMAAA